MKVGVNMAACKECVHFELCEDWFEQIKEEGLVTGERSQHQCESFKNKADFQEVKHGEWINEREFLYKCSLCGDRAFIRFDRKLCRYCPNCGAKMKEGA